MDIIKYLAKYLFIPAYELKEKQSILALLRDYSKSQFLPEDEIRAIQLERIKFILRYAQQHSSFYRQRFLDNAIDVRDLKTLNDFSAIPVLTKDDIRENLPIIISDEYKREDLLPIRTGGSTSVPLKLFVDLAAYKHRAAATVRHNLWAGYDRGDKLAALWGNTDKKYSTKQKIINLLIGRVVFLDTLKMDDEYILKFIKKVHQFKPKILMGHAHSIYTFACFVDNNKISDLGFKGIISTAEMLYDHERQKIESVFGNILYNRYGCEELSIIASECEKQDGLHINAERLFVEVINGDDTNPGKLVITDLFNTGMPIIRYEIGDMATTKTGTCACGRGLPRLGKIYGRTADLLYTPDGRTISGISVLDTFTIHIPGIKQVQIIQNELDLLNFKIVKGSDFNNESLKILKDKIPQFFGQAMKFEIDYIDKIPQTQRGKYRFSICNLPDDKKHIKI